MKKLIITESQYNTHKALLEGCNCEINQGKIDELGKKATIHVANQVKDTTDHKEYHYNDTYSDHDKKKISMGKFLSVPENHSRLRKGMSVIDNDGNLGKLVKVDRIAKGFRVTYINNDGNEESKNALFVYILV